jgi:NADPH:quinone reductase-like Zn-dependent oxidoreductase
MKAIVQDTYGTADVLEFREAPEPVPGDGEVLLEVRAAGCGPDVWHLMTGEPYLARIAPEFRRWWHHPRGRDVAGIVRSVGAGVEALAPGDEVMGIAEGSFAELAVGIAEKLVAKPSRLTFEQAAAAPIAGMTAFDALHDVADVKSGDGVLIVGATGGVGSLAVQIAKAAGARVTAVCSAHNADLARSLGAEDVIDYATEDFTDGSRRWDVIVDTAGRRPLRRLRRALTPKGTLAIVGGDGGGRVTGGFGRQVIRAPLLSLVVGQRLAPVVSKETGAGLERLRVAIEAGEVTPVVARTFSLPEAADAVRFLENGHPAGKVVVTV